MDSVQRPEPTRTTLSSVSNAIRLLKTFSANEREWGVSDLARKLDLGKSTVHRLLTTLTEEGLIEQHPETGKYQLGLAMFDLAAAVPMHHDLHEAVLSPMTELRNRSGETVQVGVLDGRQVVYIERLDSPNTMRMFLEVGRRNWAHASSNGKVLLAFLPRDRLDATLRGWKLPARTDHTITSVKALRQQLTAIRKRGWGENVHESESEVISVAAPIRDRAGRVVASISVAGDATRIAPVKTELAYATMEVAALVSRRLGYRELQTS